MLSFSKIKYLNKLSRETWMLLAFLGVMLFSVIILSQAVDLAPQVGSDFFFSSDNPNFQYAKLVSKLFPQRSSQLIISAMGDISSPEYIKRLGILTNVVSILPGVSSAKSLTSGPRNLKDAEESPLWKRLLVSTDGTSSNVIAFLTDISPQKVIPKFEDAIDLLGAPAFNLQIAGVPYVVEMIRRNLVHDLSTFSTVALIIFGAIMLLLFRSGKVFTGTIISCVEACVLTLIIISVCGIKIGILTVNLATIVFVLTLSHIIFLTHNWKTLSRDTEGDPADYVMPAVRMTFSASFWCMVTTLLGFLSLLFVQAKPLRELGTGGAIGTVMAIMGAYGIYPLFLRSVKPRRKKIPKGNTERSRSFFLRQSGWFAAGLMLVCALCLPGMLKLNTDPSLLSFFAKSSALRKGLEYIDRNGGSSPLDLVIRDSSGARLDTNKEYEKLWRLQEALENDPSVGSIISLPVIMAEGSRAPMAFLLTWESLLKWMNKPQYNAIARSFITADHISGHFILRMKESDRTLSRIEIVDRLKGIVHKHGFITEMVGGLFLLQGELAKLVSSSLIFGLFGLILFSVIIAFVISRSLRISIAMVLSLGIIPVCIFGIIGYLRVPVDIISAPAVNVAIGMGIDSMIHTVAAVRRRLNKGIDSKTAWVQARVRLWRPILSSMFIISAGFGIFGLSAFPPTRRFGFEIVLGTVLAAASAIFVLPLLAATGFLKRANKDT